jgi:acyl-CoA thioester hydrolase
LYEVKWSEIDLNGHLRHTVYGDYAVDVRVHFLSEHGFTMQRLREAGIGPVILRDETRYLKEVLLGETVTVNAQLAGISDDSSHWIFQHEVMKSNRRRAAVLRVEGGWLDLQRRRLVAPPAGFEGLLEGLTHTEDYARLPTYVKRA